MNSTSYNKTAEVVGVGGLVQYEAQIVKSCLYLLAKLVYSDAKS